MSNTITSSNMGLPIPVVGVDPGPDYGLNLDACLAKIDSHNHSPTQGVPINPNGLNINDDLPINNNNLTLARTLRFNAQPAALSLATDLGCLYESGVDLYYNDGNGNQIRITQSGNVAGASGTITGLPSGTASASYSTGTFTWQSATNTAANMDFQSAILRNSTALSKGLTLSPPSAMAANYALILPSLPSQNATFLQLDTSGNITAVSTADGIGSTMTSVGANAIGVSMTSTGANAVANSRTRATGQTVAAGGVALSTTSSGLFSGSSASFADVTNVTVTITTTGRPVYLQLVDSPADGSAALGVVQASSTIAQAVFRILNTTSSSNIATHTLTTQGVSGSLILQVPASSLSGIDFAVNGVPGTYTYQLQYEMIQGTSVSVSNAKLVAYEL